MSHEMIVNESPKGRRSPAAERLSCFLYILFKINLQFFSNHSEIIASGFILCPKIMGEEGSPVRECRMTPIGANVFGIYLAPCDNGQVKGCISGGSIRKPIPFTSLSRMILLLDEQMDISNRGSPGVTAQSPSAPSFEIEILFRQNYSWQGKVRWPAGRKEAAFRSVLELIMIIEMILEH